MDTVWALLADPRILAILSPLIVTTTKRFMPSIPKAVLPILSIVVGAFGAAIGGGTEAIAMGAVAGTVGIGVREVVDQTAKATGVVEKK